MIALDRTRLTGRLFPTRWRAGLTSFAKDANAVPITGAMTRRKKSCRECAAWCCSDGWWTR